MKKTKAVIAAALTTTMLASAALTGCGDKVNGDAVAMTINGEELSVGTANCMLRWGQAESYSTFVNMGFMSQGSAFWDSNLSEDSDATYGDNFKDSVKTSLVEDVLMRQKAEEYGVSISDEQETVIKETAAKAMEANADVFKTIGVSEENVIEVLEFYTYASLMKAPMIEGQVEEEVTDEEAAQCTITYARIYLKEKTDNGTVDRTEEEIAALREEAQNMLEQINASEDPATVDIAALTEAENTDWYATTYSYGSDDTYMAQEVKDAAATLQDGEVYQGVIEPADSDYLYLVRMDKTFDPEKTETKKASILETRKSEKFNEIKSTWVDEAEVAEKKGWKDLKVTDTTTFTAVSGNTSDTTTTEG